MGELGWGGAAEEVDGVFGPVGRRAPYCAGQCDFERDSGMRAAPAQLGGDDDEHVKSVAQGQVEVLNLVAGGSQLVLRGQLVQVRGAVE